MIKKNECSAFLGRLKKEIVSARQKAYQAVNKQLTELYLLIGKGRYEKIEVFRWGEGIVETLAKDLQRAFPDMKGFARSPNSVWKRNE